MKKILIVLLFLFLTGCEQIDEEALKEEIKAELTEELEFDINDINDHLSMVSNMVKACTVTVEVTLSDISETHGSGIVYKSDGDDYYILTNEHVIRYNQSIEVFIPSINKYLQASIIKEDGMKDLAILKITSLDIVNICEINLVEYVVGELVLSVGTPVSKEYSNTVTLGMISRIQDDLIQHDAAVNPGSSGGPLFNINGELVGLNVSRINTTYSGNVIVSVEGMAFSIIIEEIIDFIS
ncbi:MAG: Serine protease Do-like HtrA [Candidatus Izimaplasma bacterium HR2]|nr:MAG: Serine protease Do-like HtrA [Candidatus Izimaplasma bacterium HR2]